MSCRQSQDANVSIITDFGRSVAFTPEHTGDAANWPLAEGPSPRALDSTERSQMEAFNNTVGQVQAVPSKPGGGTKRGGRPVTWIGGGGLDPKKLAGLGVPMLRTLFNQVFGEPTASNNASWLRRKLSESPDVVHGQRRSAIVRARDMGAAIWNSPIPVVTVGGCEDGGLISPDADGCAGDRVMGQDCLEFDDNTAADADDAGHALLVQYGCDVGCVAGGGRRCLKRSAGSAESAETLGYRGSGNNMTCPSSPSGSGSASPTATHTGSAGASPWGRMPKPHHKYHSKAGSSSRHCSQYQTQQKQQQLMSNGRDADVECGGLVLRPDVLSAGYQGLRVNVFWPQDNKWWEATICQVDPVAGELQLLYSDMTEEVIKGSDFTDLLCKGHLVLAPGVAPPHTSMTRQQGGCTQQQDLGTNPQVQGSAAAAAAAAAGPALVPGIPNVSDTSWLDSAGASIAAGIRSQSCLLPLAVHDSRTSPPELTRSASASFIAKGSGAGGGGGSSSGAASASFGDFDELTAKRQCYEASGNTGSGSDEATNQTQSFAGFLPATFPANTEQQGQQQGPDAANLGAWFHAQQQQQLQLQVQQNLQVQQQAQMQFRQQMHMAAQLSMQQAAAQFLQMPPPAPVAPATAAGVMCMGAAAAVGSPVPAAIVCPTPMQSPVASGVLTPQQLGGGSPVAAGRSNTLLANDIEQLKQLQQRLRLAVGSPSEAGAPRWPVQLSSPCTQQGTAQGEAMAASAAPCTMKQPAMMQQQQQEMQMCGQYSPGPTSNGGNCSPAAAAAACYVPQGPILRGCSSPLPAGCFNCNSGRNVWPNMAPGAAAAAAPVPLLHKSVSCDAAVVPDVGNMKPEPLSPTAAAAVPPAFTGTLQVTDCDDIDTLLAKPGDMFDLSMLGVGVEKPTRMGRETGDMDGMDMGDGSLGGDGPSSSCGGSLCESLADELAVAGLEVDAAPAYFMFGRGSPRLQEAEDAVSQGFNVVAIAAVAPAVLPAAPESQFAHMFDD